MPTTAPGPIDDLLRLTAAGLAVLATSNRRVAVAHDAATAVAARRHAGLPDRERDPESGPQSGPARRTPEHPTASAPDVHTARAALDRVVSAVATAESVAPDEALAGIAAVAADAAAAVATDSASAGQVEPLAPRPDLTAHAHALVAAAPADPVGAAPDAVVALVVAHLLANQLAPWRP